MRYRIDRTLRTLSVALLCAAAACQKAPPPANPTSTATMPQIGAGGGDFGTDSWRSRKAEHSRNVSAGAGESFAHVTYKPEVKIVEQAAFEASLQGIGSDGHGLVFKRAPPQILALKPGDVLMVKSRFAAKILAAETDGEQTVLITDLARLVDVVQQGTIHLDTPISFHGPAHSAARAAPSPPRAPPPFRFMDLWVKSAYAQVDSPSNIQIDPSMIPNYARTPPGRDGGSASDQVKASLDSLLSGWNVETWSVTPGDNVAQIEGKMTKDLAGFLALVALHGTISNFRFAQNLTFPVNTEQLIANLHGLSGEMHFLWEVGKNTPGVWATEDKLKLPAGVTIPLGDLLGGLPLTLDISAALIIHPGLTGNGEAVKGSFIIKFDGSQSAMGLNFEVTKDASLSPIAPNGMVIGFCAPRLELRLGMVGAYSWSSTLTTAATAADAIISKVASGLPPNVLAALHNSPLNGVSVSNALASNADVFAQIIHTEGVSHTANNSPAQCTKIDLTVTGQVGGEAQLFNVTTPTSKRDVFTKTFRVWKPGSEFCKSV